MTEIDHNTESSGQQQQDIEEAAGEKVFYKIRFREDGQEFTVESQTTGLVRGDAAMIKTDHGLEPAMLVCRAPCSEDCVEKRGASYELARRLTAEEQQSFVKLPEAEEQAFEICQQLIDKHSLDMNLVRVEKFFNGSKMIFYFTADNRVDFRELVKDLVQEFRTRVEMRQVGVRHETKMLGGLGTCGRELCCSSYMKKFDSVSIKMAKEQDLPLNPSKISGVCNRLLCCLTYEFSYYREQRKKMPKVGSRLRYDGKECKVKRQIPLQKKIVMSLPEGDEIILDHDQWQNLERIRGERSQKKKKKNGDTE